MELTAQILQQGLQERSKSDAGSSLLNWTTNYRRFLKPDVRFDLSNHRYLRDIYLCDAQVVTIYKAGQMGASEYAISYAIHGCDVLGATVLYVFPTDSHISDFSSARIGPALEASDYLAHIVGDVSRSGGRRQVDRVSLKRIRDSFLYLRGARVTPAGYAAQLKSIDADILILDEWDEMDRRAPEIALKRLGHSDLGQVRKISTPTYSGTGIHVEYLKSDQREWHVKCTCGHEQAMTVDNLVLEWDHLSRPIAWNKDDDGRAVLRCAKCDRELDRTGPGRWISTNPGAPEAGFHLTKFFSHVASMDEIIGNLQKADQTVRKETYNQDLGLPYTPVGGRLTDDILNKCLRDYAPGPVAGEQAFMGVDVGKLINVVIRGAVNKRGERPLRYLGEVNEFADVGRLMRQYNVSRCVVDGLPETRESRRFQSAFRKGVVWLAFYTGSEKSLSSVSYNEAELIVSLDRTRTMDETMSLFSLAENTLPRSAAGDRDYYSHLKAPVRVVETSGSTTVARYVETGPDHYAHAENYCYVASLPVNLAKTAPAVTVATAARGW